VALDSMSSALAEHSAADSAAGYLFQCRYALLAAIREGYREPNLEISIERYDDVAFEVDGSPYALIQTKHHVSRQGNLTDASVDLWKTLGIWVKMAREDPSAPSRLRMMLLTTALAPDGSAASYLRLDGRDETRAGNILRETAQSSRNKRNAGSYVDFLALPEEVRSSLLKSVYVLDSSPNITDVGEELGVVLRPGAPRGRVHLLTERLEGWWIGLIARNLTEQSLTIPFTTVENKIDEIRDSLTRESLPVDYADIIPPVELVDELDKRPFVKQLRLIRVGNQRIQFAIRDYYRAFQQRSRWVREQLLVNDELERYERQLLEAWQPRFERKREQLASDCNPEDKVRVGDEIYQWVETEADFPLRTVRERFLCQGSFHMLANRCALGWHPEYASRISSND
jgi:hypothetical protein